MKTHRIGNILHILFFSGLLAGELAVLLDVLFVLRGTALSVPKFAGLFAVLFLLAALPWLRKKVRAILAVTVAAVICVPLLAGFLCWKSVSDDVVYHGVDDGKSELYADQRVMLLVPHQDDDINVLGGVMEEYVKYGSDVTVVFSTNGDYYDGAAVRLREAVTALGTIGIPEENVIFLGYGDQWDPKGPHLYNAQPGETMRSYIGYTETYGTDWHKAYREGQPYTADNFLADIESVILEYRPDVIYCVDWDYNIDHRALSLAFEKVMGNILKNEPDYRPCVRKGYAYNTAWEAERDFYSENILSAQNVFEEPYLQQPRIYRWQDRVRLPVNAESLSRSVISAGQNRVLSMYASQGANMYGVRVINGDKVFWERDTGSVCYQAQVQTSSANAEYLTDFMILESKDLLAGKEVYCDGVWIPDASDPEKRIDVSFLEPVDIREIVLYDHPDPDKNVLNVRIQFEDGEIIETGALDPEGAATAVAVNRNTVSAFSVELEQVQGEAGLTELEAFGEERNPGPRFVKIMDKDENFLYDCWIDPDGEELFFVYDTCGNPGNYTVSCEGDGCSVQPESGGIRVFCPEGEHCTVTVVSEDGTCRDSIYVQNPSGAERRWKKFWLGTEETVMNLCDTKRIHERLFVCRLYGKISSGLR